jgi:hypothetical protein
MGRKPIGAAAMSPAERVRRHREKRRREAPPVTKPVTKEEAAALRTRNAELEKEVMGLLKALAKALAKAEAERPPRSRPKPDPTTESGRLTMLLNASKRRATRLEKEMDSMQAQGRLTKEQIRSVIKCLHPDSRGHATQDELNEACGLMTTVLNPKFDMREFLRRWSST